MRLFRVDFKDKIRPPILIRGKTKAQVALDMKEKYGEYILKVDYISHEDAEAQFGHFDLFKEGINVKKADMGDVIDDFYKSDAPQFKGKSKAKRRQMAIAAKLSADEAKKVPSMASLENKPKMKIQLKKATNAYDKNKDVLAKHGFKRPSMNENDKYDDTNEEVTPMLKQQFQVNEKDGLYANIHAKRARIKAGSGEKMKSPGDKGAPTKQDWKDAAKTAKPQNEKFANAAQQAAAMAAIKAKPGYYKKPKSEGVNDLPKRPPLTDKEKKFNAMMNKNKPGAFSHQKARMQDPNKREIRKMRETFGPPYAEFITPESDLNEEMYFKVNITGLPDMYMTASSAGMIKAKLRKMLKNMDMIGDIVKTPKAEVRKAFRMKAMEGEESQSESVIAEDKMPSKAHIMKMCKDGKSKKEICDMHPDCDQGKLKEMIDDCMKEMKQDESITEISKRTAANYIGKASRDAYFKGRDQGQVDAISAVGGSHPHQDYKKSPERKAAMRMRGIDRATKRLGRSEGKAYGPTGISYYVPSGHKDEVDPKTKQKYPERQKPDYKGPKSKFEAVREDLVDNKLRFGPPQEPEVQEAKKKSEDNYEINLTSMLTGENPFYRALPERNIQFHTGHSAGDSKQHAAHREMVNAIHKEAGANVTKRRSGYPDKSGKNMQGMITAKKKDNVQAVVEVIKKHIPKSAHKSIKVSEEAIDEKQRLDPKCWDGYKKQGTKMKGGIRVNNCVPEGHDEIQDKNADGLDDNQKPEGNKTAKQFDAGTKKKEKKLKMEYFKQDEVSDFMIEKSKLKKGDMKMRGGKLDPKAMAALKTMSQDEAKVLVQGLPANLRRSTMKELGIKEVVDGRTKAFKSTVERLITAKNKPEIDEADMTDAQMNTAKKDDSAMVKAAQKKARADVVTAMNKPKMADEAMTPPKMPSKADNRQADKDFAKLSPAAQTHANNSMRQGASGTDAVARAKKHFGEVSKDMLKRYVKAADLDKSRKHTQADVGKISRHAAHVNQIMRNRGIDMAKSKMKPAKVAATEANIDELSMKADKKLPNLKVPVKGPKGVSKYERKKGIRVAK